jgi:hypothetical protein
MNMRFRGRRRTALALVMCLTSGLALAQQTPAPDPAQTPALAPPAPPTETSADAVPAAEGYGLRKAEAIEVCEPMGQRQYLARLLCPDSLHPEFARAGNVGPRQDIPENASDEMLHAMMADMLKPRKLQPGEPDYHIVDAYEVACGEQVTVLYLDMYHCAQDRPDRAPAGFTIID